MDKRNNFQAYRTSHDLKWATAYMRDNIQTSNANEWRKRKSFWTFSNCLDALKSIFHWIYHHISDLVQQTKEIEKWVPGILLYYWNEFHRSNIGKSE